jgi:hypothetical protein
MKKIIPLLIFTLALIISCGQNDGFESSSEKPVMAEMRMAKTSDDNINDKDIASDRKIIKTGRISFQTDDLEEKSYEIKKLIKSYNAYITNEYKDKYTNKIEQRFEVKIPADKFDDFVVEVEKIAGKVESRSINSEDITDQYIDTESRLKNKKKLEERYLELLDKAKNINEILQIERELNNIRSDIESAEALLQSYDKRVAYSTLNIDIYKEISTSEKNSWGSRFGNGFKNGFEYFILFFVGLTHFWPFFILAGIIVFIVLRVSKKKKGNKK